MHHHLATQESNFPSPATPKISKLNCALFFLATLVSIVFVVVASVLFGLIDGDPNYSKDPNALNILHNNCTVLENNVDRRCSKGCECRLKLQYPILFNNSTSSVYKIGLTPLFSTSTYSYLKVNETINCFTNREETKVSVDKYSAKYRSFYASAVVLMSVGSVLFGMMFFVTLIINYKAIKHLVFRRNQFNEL
ncbi:hypothetical protein ABK040_001186 [Willaertia magna]